jgi:hypothetical protein
MESLAPVDSACTGRAPAALEGSRGGLLHRPLTANGPLHLPGRHHPPQRCAANARAPAGATPGAVRLMQGNATAGRVEVCVGGLWGTVCSQGWDNVDASVACRQLGYAGGVALTRTSGVFPPGTNQRIHMSSVACNGSETGLTLCAAVTQSTGCVHRDDAGAACYAAHAAPRPPAALSLQTALWLPLLPPLPPPLDPQACEP